jgi:hypothetical protein
LFQKKYFLKVFKILDFKWVPADTYYVFKIRIEIHILKRDMNTFNRILTFLHTTQTTSRKSIGSLSDARRPYLNDGRDCDYTASIIIL